MHEKLKAVVVASLALLYASPALVEASLALKTVVVWWGQADA